MVRALLAGTKTQTRRVVKPQPYDDPSAKVRMHSPGVALFGCLADAAVGDEWVCPYGAPGDRLWVRETFYCDDFSYPDGLGVSALWREVDGRRMPVPLEEQHKRMLEDMYYRADGEPEWEAADGRTPWRPSIHMPRWASRILLEVIDVRVERLQAISRGDAMAEGCPFPNMAKGDDPRQWYRDLWDQISGTGAWDANPWCWAISFTRITA